IAGIAVGGLIGLEAMFAGPVTGASMNPVRSLAPAVVSGDLGHLWIYLIAPTLGAAAMAPLHAWLMRPDAPGAAPGL
ncbi:MAG TPA: aquaporin, partial [Tepidisphaeraceae bacterium]|nr:aquaporin [Tepidisphaeraceae bacterium]